MHAAEFGRKGAKNQPNSWPGRPLESLVKPVRTGTALCLSLFIVLGPAAGQIFGHHSVFLREWIMFAGAGIGVLKGSFTLHRPDGTLVRMTPLEILELKRYPGTPPYDFDRRVFEDRDLRAYAPTLCDGPSGPALLSFQGAVGTRQGWHALDVKDVCALPHAPAPDTAGARDGVP